MTQKTRAQLKALWIQGYKPLEGDYDDVWDSFVSFLDDIAESFVFGSQATGGSETVSFSATPTFDLDDGNSQQMTLTGNLTSLSLTNKENGGSYLIYLIQDATGSRTIPTPDSSFGNETDNSASFVTDANAVNLINVNVRPDGTTYYTVETYTP